ncbi:MAG: molybdopterin adenylyltransferase [Thermosediminibacterales bacterium]|nr:molybdopterin adenylyltransferase [Thermosediminibacterales bacterium]MDK2835337.1 molybdopterin adenylyltransferase [Thermosediminibacterales bacterium]
MIIVGILTASDKGYRGQREDLSGQVIREMVKKIKGEVKYYRVVPDEKDIIKNELIKMCDEGIDLIITTGGTGLSPRDVTPDATLEVIEKQIPGMAEAMRAKGIVVTPHAMLSRAVCGVRGKTMIINLPGSPKAVRENLEVVLKAIPHGIDVLKGQVEDCARGRLKN